MSRTIEQQAQTIANYLPSGRAFGAKNVPGTIIRMLLRGLSGEMITADDLLALFRKEIIPEDTIMFLSEWEDALGIPDDCFSGIGDIADRQLKLLLKLSWMHLQTEQDFIDLAAELGLAITIESGAIHGAFPYTFPIVFYTDANEAHHTIIIHYTIPDALTFPYTFPIVFTTPVLTLLACLFNKLKPANCQVIFEGI